MYGKYNPRPPETVFYPLQTFAISLSLHFLDVETMRKPLLLIVLLLAVLAMHAEGTKEIMPTASSHGCIIIYPTFTPFASGIDNSAQAAACPVDYRLNIRINTPTENIHFGFGDFFDDTSNDIKTVFYRIRDPNGNQVAFGAVPSSGTGYISTYEQAVAGPIATSGSTGGYSGLMYNPTMSGDFSIEFYNASSPRALFKYFDITVATGSGTKKPGRIWSKSWQFTGDNITSTNYYPFTGSVYVYSDDQIVTKVNFNNIQPYVFSVTCNDVGTNFTGNIEVDRQSKSGTSINLLAQYKIFLNDPDPNVFPTGTFGSITAPVTSQSYCNGGADFYITVNKVGKVEMFFDINPLPGVQPEDKKVTEEVAVGMNTIYWDGTNGLGQHLTNGVTIPITITYINGLTNLPLKDPDNHPNGFLVTLIRPTGPMPKIYWDDSQLYPGAINLDGCLGGEGCHNFTDDIGDGNTINTWWYASSTSTDVIQFEYRYTSYATASAPLCPGQTLVINGQTITTPGTYPFTLVNYMGCDSLVTYTVNAAANPVVNLPPNQTLCPGDEITLDAGAGFASYLWSTTATTQTIVASQPGTYTVTVTNAAGCQASDSFVYYSSGPPPNPIKHN